MKNNPVIWADYPDPDVIRVDDTYYMVSTTTLIFSMRFFGINVFRYPGHP
jgi:beta-xylosidase